MAKLKQNFVSEMAERGVDLAPRWKKILKEIAQKYSFVPDEQILSKSRWWKRPGKVGAVHCPGIISLGSRKQRAVLKIQGVRPTTSEGDMISEFEKQNTSKIIRPPKIFWFSPWDDKKQYEAFIMEEVVGKPAIINHPATEKELVAFFDLYEEYRKNCINTPWVSRPTSFSYRQDVKKWMKATEELRKKDKFKEVGDAALAERAIQAIEKNFKSDDLEFMHGHFQPGDLIVTKSHEVVLFSNLFWSWRIPFYDAVFGYHWWMLGMEHAKSFSEELLEKERRRWLDKMFDLPSAKKRPGGERLLNLALLERAIPALIVDRYLMDQTKLSAEIVAEAARRELKRLITQLD